VDRQTGDPASTLSTYRRLLARRRELLAGLPETVELLDTAADVLAVRRGPLLAVLNTAAEPVQVPVDGATEVLEATADGVLLEDGVVTVPAAATAWLRG
jgi:alpha-glucosidase